MNFAINYEIILQQAHTDSVKELAKFLYTELEYAWHDSYEEMSMRPVSITGFPWQGFSYWFDCVYEIPKESLPQTEEYIEDRVIVVYGFSHPKEDYKRDTSRQRGYPLMIRRGDGSVKYDRGHFLGHSMGGGLDVNLFPQRRDINRGWSERGKVFRKMERYCQEHPGTFCFSRPIYDDQTSHPAELEFGLLMEDGKLWVERFDN